MIVEEVHSECVIAVSKLNNIFAEHPLFFVILREHINHDDWQLYNQSTIT
jgi:hypothetical protein